MKRSVLLLLFACVLTLLNAAVGITSVNMEDYSGTVVRVVIGLSATGDYKINAGSGSLEFRLDNFISNSQARIATKDSNLVTAIQQDGEVLRINIRHPYRYETTRFDYPSRIALDIFKTNPSKQERLAIAEFYSETGKLNSADKTYNDLHIDYREDAQILYQWAVLLHKRGSNRATEKLSLISQDSPYYKKAQLLMAKLHADEEPLPPPPPITEVPQPVVSEVPAAPAESVVVAEPTTAPLSKPTAVKTPNRFNNLVPMLLLVGILLAAAVLIFVFAFKLKPPVKHESADFMETDLALDTKTMCRMVSKLLSDGWSMREIAKELKISQREVEVLVQMCHSGVHDDQDS